MKIGSLFSGIGALDLGLEFATQGRTVWHAEKDPRARAVLARHWPGVPVFEDAAEAVRAPRVDLLAGGFPCQDISQLGSRKGLDGEKSGQWSIFRDVIEALEPSYVFIENVGALAHRGLDRVLHSLAALGFDAQWDRVRASFVGAPHARARTFVLAYSDTVGLRDVAARRLHGRSIESLREDAGRRYADLPRATDGPRKPDPGSGRGLVPGVLRTAHGSTSRMDRDRRARLALIGNAANVDQVEIAFLILALRAIEDGP